MLLGLINLGSTSAFLAFVSVGVMALAVSYAIPIAISLLHKRVEVNAAIWNCGPVIGTIANVVSLLWITFEVVLFSMPTALPVTEVTMNYASVVLVGFMVIAGVWYFAHARKGMSLPLLLFLFRVRTNVICSLQGPSCLRWSGTMTWSWRLSACDTELKDVVAEGRKLFLF